MSYGRSKWFDELYKENRVDNTPNTDNTVFYIKINDKYYWHWYRKVKNI